MSWSFELGLEEVLAGLGVSCSGDPERQEEELAEERALVEAQQATARDLTGVIVEMVPAGPGLAAWLANAPTQELSDWDLPGIAAAFRRVASWAQAGELAAVASMASRAAARDDKIRVDDDGRPELVPAGATSEVSLALTLSQCGAEAWTDLAVVLRWRLPATGTALAAGTIDLARARLIAEATNLLTDEHARAVEDRVLPGAGSKTNAQLRVALRRAVISVDPAGAEERRQDAERRAKIALYPDETGNAALGGYNLPGVLAAAAMARLSAMARAMKAGGAGGGLDLLRSQVFLGLLLGTLPLIPPGPDQPPDRPPDSGDDPGDDPGPGGPDSGGGPGPDPGLGRHAGREGASVRDKPSGPGTHDRDRPVSDDPGSDDPGTGFCGLDDPGSGFCGLDDPGSGFSGSGFSSLDDPGAGNGEVIRWTDEDDDDRLAQALTPAWPPLPATLAEIPPVLGRPPPGPATRTEEPTAFPLLPRGRHLETGRPPPGLLDITVPWAALTTHALVPAILGRLGPITEPQARPLLQAAARDPAAQWRVVLTDPDGRALAVERVRRGQPAREPGQRGPGVVGRVTVTYLASALNSVGPPPSGAVFGGGIQAAVERAARRAGERAQQTRAADAAAAGGCAHTASSPAYRPPPRIREYVEARDQTCRHPVCRQPAWRADLDHTVPYDKGGLTCTCNTGGLCRTHHQVKQLPGWNLTQSQPGVFTWTTPAGRRYTMQPDPY